LREIALLVAGTLTQLQIALQWLEKTTRLIAAEALDPGPFAEFIIRVAALKAGDVAAPRWGGKQGREDVEDVPCGPASRLQDAIGLGDGGRCHERVGEQSHARSSE